MDDPVIEEEDEEALASLVPFPPRRKMHSYSVQLDQFDQKPHHQIRKHSLDEVPRSTTLGNDAVYFDSSDEEFSTGGAIAIANASGETVSDGGEDYAVVAPPPNAGVGEDAVEPLPEFIGAGGGAGIFKVPVRAAVHPGRPPCLELRPHPLRETQTGKFLRNIACTETQLWAGQENGVRVWNMEEVYDAGCGIGGQVQRGDEDTAPFHESVATSPTMCLVADQSNKLLWSGHKDGKIRAWKMDQEQPCEASDDSEPFKERISWLAHRGPVNSIVISSYGDMWSCSEGGVIKIWPWDSLEKSLLIKPAEKHMAALLVERSAIDLRTQVTVNGTCSISSSEVKFLLTDSVRAKVWAVQSLSFSIWDARSKDLLKVLNVDGQVECRVDTPPTQDQHGDDETKLKFFSASKKEKPQGFLQRSRNAIMGAAGAVRRVATRSAGGFAEDTRKTEAIVLAVDGTIWTGNMSGQIVQWDGNGSRLKDVNHHHKPVLCFCSFGDRIYVGYASGYIQVLDFDGKLMASWVSHNEPVIKLAAGGGFIFSLATHGGVRGWYVTSPGPLDNIIRTELSQKEALYARQDNVRILIGTWNVGQGRATHGALMSWLGSVASDVGIVVIGLQEVDMGAGFLAMSAAKETVGLEGSVVGQWWIDAIGKALDEKNTFERMGSRQLAGLLISLWARKEIRTHVGDLDVAAVPCGFGRAIGNKGGVGLRIRVYDRIMCFVNCHLAAHLEAVNRRNADFNHIFRLMVFSKGHNLSNTAAGMVLFLFLSCSLGFSTYLFWLLYSSGLPWALSLAAGVSTTAYTLKTTTNPTTGTEEVKSDLAAADLIAFFGDFNYRLYGITYDEARDFISQRSFDWLRERDQLRQEMKAGKVFQGMREALITFPPTYKFEKNRPGLGGYDSGEKKRIPAWCDRVIYRDTQASPFSESNLQCPVVSSVIMYEACMDVTESDHKPVRCKFHATIAHVDKSVRRQELGNIIRTNEKIKSIFEDLKFVPETSVSTNSIVLQSQDTVVLTITNTSTTNKAMFSIICGGTTFVKDDGEESDYTPRGSFGLPRWLEMICITKTRLLCSPNSLPIETPPHIISLGAGEAFGRRRRAICTTARSSPSSASFFVVLSLCSVVSVVSNNAVSSSFSVTTAPVLSSTYLRVSPPPPLLTVMKSSHLSTLPETISNHGRSLLLTLSVLLFHPGIVKPRTCGSMLSMKNLQLDPTYAEPLEPDLLVSLVLGFTSPSPVRRLCQSTPLSRLSPSPDRVTNASHRLHPTPASFLTCLYATDYTPNIEAAPSHQGFYGAKLHRLDLRLLVTTGPIVQECCFARFPHEVFTVASLSHYAVSSIDGSSQNRICGLPDLLVAGTIVQECGLARFTNSITAAIPSHYAVSSIDGSSQLCDLHTGVVTRRPIHPEAFYLLSDVCSHTLWLNESDDYLLRSSVTTCWARHGNVEFRVLDPIQPSALSSNLCSPSASLEVKLELEIHLVYSVSHVGFKADRTCFSAKSSQIGLSSLNVVYGSGASHLKFLPINIPTSSYRCFNVVFDYQLFFRTIAMGTKVKLLFGFLHFAERDSPLYGSISSFSVLVSSFILPSSRAPGLSASAVNVAL